MSSFRTKHEEPIEWQRVDAPHEMWTVTLLPGAIGLVLTACFEPDNYETGAWEGYRARVRLRVFGADSSSFPFESVASSIDDAKERAEQWARTFLEATATETGTALAALGSGPWTCTACVGMHYVNVAPDHERCTNFSVRHTGIGRHNFLTVCACLERGHAPPAKPVVDLASLGGER